MRVFDSRKRTYAGPSENTEIPYSWLNRSSSPEAERARSYIESLYAQYPDPRGELLGKLSSESRGITAHRGFYASLGSLYLYDHFKRLGYEVTADEEGPPDRRRPDLQLTSSEGTVLVIEIVAPFALDDRERSDWRLQEAADELNRRLELGDYYLGLKATAPISAVCPASRLAKAVAARIAELPEPDEVLSLPADRMRELLRLDFVFDGGVIGVRFIPRSRSAASRQNETADRRIVGTVMSGARIVDPAGRIRKSLKRKRPARYGIAAGPYVVAALGMGVLVDDYDVKSALCGTEAVVFRRDGEGEGQLTRQNDGFFSVRNGRALNTRVSGVMFLRNFRALQFKPEEVQKVFYANANAASPVPSPATLGVDRVFGVLERDDNGATLGWLPQD